MENRNPENAQENELDAAAQSDLDTVFEIEEIEERLEFASADTFLEVDELEKRLELASSGCSCCFRGFRDTRITSNG
jgi:hypothetical protein